MRSQAVTGLLAAWITLASLTAAGAEKPRRIFLWPKDAEVQEPRLSFKTRDPVMRITDIETPYLTLHPAASAKPAPAVVVCPGGGYRYLCIDKEGTETAPWLNGLEITAVVLAYSTPNKRDAAFADAQRAVRLVRHHAKAWNIDPKRIGIMGFSAGGHLAVRLSTEFDKAAYERVDEIDTISCRPDFSIPVYPAYLADKGTLKVAVHKRIPPTVIVHTSDDKKFVQGSTLYFEALQKAAIPSKFLLFEKGGHGYGLRSPKDTPVAAWPARCGEWLTANGFGNK
jgi:acetyl esterase/lipase